MGRNARRRHGNRIPATAEELIRGIRESGLDPGEVAAVVHAGGHQGFTTALVDIDPDSTEAFKITCSTCGATGTLPSRPSQLPDKITCGKCMMRAVAGRRAN